MLPVFWVRSPQLHGSLIHFCFTVRFFWILSVASIFFFSQSHLGFFRIIGIWLAAFIEARLLLFSAASVSSSGSENTVTLGTFTSTASKKPLKEGYKTITCLLKADLSYLPFNTGTNESF